MHPSCTEVAKPQNSLVVMVELVSNADVRLPPHPLKPTHEALRRTPRCSYVHYSVRATVLCDRRVTDMEGKI